MDAAKARFLFGVEGPGFDPMDEDELSGFYADALRDAGEGGHDEVDDLEGPAVLRTLMLTVVAKQVRDDDPPDVWATARRLLEAGLDRTAALDQLALAMSRVVDRAMAQGADTEAEGEDAPPPVLGVADSVAHYQRLLAELPVAGADQLAELACAHVAEHQGGAIDELRRVLREAVGTGDDDLGEAAVDAALSRFEGPFSELVGLRTGRVVHLPSLTEGMVLTHRLTEEEAFEEQLACVATDLAGFAWRHELRDVHRADIEVFPLGEGAEVGWAGVERWLGGARAGSALAVRVEAPGVVRLHAPAELPAPEGPLVEDLRAAYDESLGHEPYPVLVADLLAELLLRRPGAFAEPQAPLVELCAAAGLEVREGYAVHDDATWAELVLRQRSDRIHDAFDGDHEPAHLALDVLAQVDEPSPPAAALRSALATLADEQLAGVVLDELLGGERGLGALPAVAAWARRLVEVARRPGEQMAAHWVAALVAERAGEVLDADRHLRAAFDADSGWGGLVDRVAWYASDRGDAGRAAELWRLLEEPGPAELAAVASAGTGAAPKVGRNDPCWCGSGRKAKACHRGEPPRPPLVERADWLYTKAVAHLSRQDEGTEDLAVVATVGQRLSGIGPPPAEGGDWPVDDPIVLDVALHELEWFDRFLEDRAPLLPADEVEVGEAWVDAERVVAEVVSAPPDGPVVLRDLGAGGEVEVVGRVGAGARSPRSGSVLAGGEAPEVGSFVCGRPLPVAGEWRLAAGFTVPAGDVDQARQLCATADGYGLAGLALRLSAGG